MWTLIRNLASAAFQLRAKRPNLVTCFMGHLFGVRAWTRVRTETLGTLLRGNRAALFLHFFGADAALFGSPFLDILVVTVEEDFGNDVAAKFTRPSVLRIFQARMLK